MDSVKMTTSATTNTGYAKMREDLLPKNKEEGIKDQVSLGSTPVADNRLKDMAGKPQAQSMEKTLDKAFTVINGGLIGLFAGAVIGSLIAGPAGPVLATLASAGFGSIGMVLGGMIGGLKAAGKE